jgi:starch phosphorylase
MDWDQAWEITRKPSAIPTTRCCPRRWSAGRCRCSAPPAAAPGDHLRDQRRFLDEVARASRRRDARIARLSLIDESGERYVRMANLACVGSHAINGVAALHTELLKRDVLHDFYALWPEKFSNKTNGVTPRRWMALSNPRLTR